jgi:hypothetical protein
MTKLLHTPGPWTRGYGNYVYQGAELQPGTNQRLIAICEPSSKTREDWDQTFANAALIAEAPALLEALRMVLDMPPFDGTTERSQQRLRTKMFARDVLARAEKYAKGESK